MKQAQFGTHAGLPVSDEERLRDAAVPRTCPTPMEFLAQAGRVVCVCLGLALLAQAVVAMLGAN